MLVRNPVGRQLHHLLNLVLYIIDNVVYNSVNKEVGLQIGQKRIIVTRS
jgi:hypothetical protein